MLQIYRYSDATISSSGKECDGDGRTARSIEAQISNLYIQKWMIINASVHSAKAGKQSTSQRFLETAGGLEVGVVVGCYSRYLKYRYADGRSIASIP